MMFQNDGMMGNILMMATMKENVNMYQVMFGLVFIQIMNSLPYIKNTFMYFMNLYGFRILIKILEKICVKFGMESLYRDFYDFGGFQKWVMPRVQQDGEHSTEKEVKSSIFFQNPTIEKEKKEKIDEDVVLIIQALNNHICNITESRYLFYYKQYYSLKKEAFLIAPDIWCQVLGTKNTDNIEIFIERYSIMIFSYAHELPVLKKYIEDMKRRYQYELNNKLGEQRFFFDEQHVSLPRTGTGHIRFEMAPRDITFSMTPFHTNKSFMNLFGSHLHTLKERVKLFIENPKWYMERGIPHTLGIMLHGNPGTGKTSVIKAIANDTNRHIFNIKLSPDTTQSQLRNLFFKEKIVVNSNGTNITYNIPLDERIYVIEDIDCLTDIVYKRKPVVQEEKPSEEDDIMPFTNDNMFGSHADNHIISDIVDNKKISPFRDDSIDSSEQLTLAFILNLLDGILETPNRILIMTTNYPEKLDDALVRAGRIDIKVHVDNCTLEMIKEMYKFFYGMDLEGVEWGGGITPITPAEMNKICIDHFNDAKSANKAIIDYLK
jgi:hypothetical protein